MGNIASKKLFCPTFPVENGSSASSSVHKDLFGALNEQKEFLEAELCQKIERLRELCLQEAVSLVSWESLIEISDNFI